MIPDLVVDEQEDVAVGDCDGVWALLPALHRNEPIDNVDPSRQPLQPTNDMLVGFLASLAVQKIMFALHSNIV